jgi:hypothetical protein
MASSPAGPIPTLLNPYDSFEESDLRPSLFNVLADGSPSMSTPDAGDAVTRWKALTEAFTLSMQILKRELGANTAAFQTKDLAMVVVTVFAVKQAFSKLLTLDEAIKFDLDELRAKVKGGTAIGKTILDAGKRADKLAPPTIFRPNHYDMVITDGGENAGGNPVKASRTRQAKGHHTIIIAVGAAAKIEMLKSCPSKEGNYVPVSDASKLKQALKDMSSSVALAMRGT